MTDSDELDYFAIRSAAFLQWLEGQGASISSKIRLEDFRTRQAGRGVAAIEDIDEDVELFRIPRSTVLTTETSSLPHPISKSIDDPWLSLIAAMTYEYYRGLQSKWKPYFDILPKVYNTLMFWDDNDLRHLEGSAIVHKIGKDSADEAFRKRVIPALQTCLSDLGEEVLLPLCHNMGSTIMAYAFDLENPSTQDGRPQSGEEDGWEEDDEDATVKGMVPLADMLNADADRNNAKLFYEDEWVVMKSISPIKAGDEILNDYGPLPTADVLRRYGYVTPNYAKYDVVEISLDMIRDAVKDHKIDGKLDERIQYLDNQDVLDDGFDVCRAESEDGQFSDELRVVLNILTLPHSQFENLKSKDKLPKTELTKPALDLLYTVLLRRRAMYTTEDKGDVRSAERDATAAQKKSEKRSLRRTMAQVVVDGEIRVLQEAAEAVQELLRTQDNKKRKADTFLQEAKALRNRTKQSKSV